MSEAISKLHRKRATRAVAALCGAGALMALVAAARALPSGAAADVTPPLGVSHGLNAVIPPGPTATPAAAASEAGVRVVAQRTGCRERGLFVRWTLYNPGSRPVSGVLRAALRPHEGAPAAAVSATESVDIGAGQSRKVTFRFAREAVAEDMQVVLGVRAAGGDFDELHSADARFPCLRECPAVEVLVRTGGVASDDDARVCPRRGRWIGNIATQDKQSAYCSYAWEASDGAAPDLDLFDDLDAGDWEKDCLSVGAQGALGLDELAQTTDARLGIDDLNAIARAPGDRGLPARYPVRLAVIDTAAHPFERTDVDDTSDHGRVVGLVARRTACGDAAQCAIRIDNRPALRVVYDSMGDVRTYAIDAENGGYIGSQSQIARAINRTLRDWDREREHLVINLSLGWHEKFSCRRPGCGQPLHVDMESRMLVPNGTPTGYAASDGDAEGFGLGTRAVLVAIARARCMGALVLAAVGNAVGGNDRGPLLPAAWNGLDASRLDCASAFDGVASTGHPTGGLVQAVAAVGFDGGRAALSRKNTLPFIVAHGVGVTVRDTRPRAQESGGFSGPLSGSSLATATASGAAASLWSLMGRDATAEQVLETLYETGAPIAPDRGQTEPPSSDLCGRRAADVCRTPKEVEACTALRAFGVEGCSADRVLPRSSRPTTVPLLSVSIDADGSYDTVALAAENEPEPFSAEGLVDMYEAPFSQPQPGPIKCATCALYRDANRYQLDLADAFSEDGTHIIAAYAHVLRADFEPIPLASSLITRQGALHGRVHLSSFDVGDSPVTLIVEYPPTSEGIPVSATELVETLLDP